MGERFVILGAGGHSLSTCNLIESCFPHADIVGYCDPKPSEETALGRVGFGKIKESFDIRKNLGFLYEVGVRQIGDSHEHIKLLPKLRFKKCLDLLQHSNLLFRNPLNGLIKAFLLVVPCVDLGTRQAKRSAPNSVLRVCSVVDCLLKSIQVLSANKARSERTDSYVQTSVAQRVLARIETIWPRLFEQKNKRFGTPQ